MADTTVWPAYGLVPNDTSQADPATTTVYISYGLIAREYNEPVPPPPVTTTEPTVQSKIANAIGMGIGFCLSLLLRE